LAGLNRFRMGSSGWLLWTRYWTFSFHNRRGMSWLAEWLPTSVKYYAPRSLLVYLWKHVSLTMVSAYCSCSFYLVWCNFKALHSQICISQVGFEVLTAVSMKIAVFWVVAPCSLVEVYQRFRDSNLHCISQVRIVLETMSMTGNSLITLLLTPGADITVLSVLMYIK
jgi:hypothetical protein